MLYLCSVFWLVQATLVHTYEVERGFETADCACVCVPVCAFKQISSYESSFQLRVEWICTATNV